MEEWRYVQRKVSSLKIRDDESARVVVIEGKRTGDGENKEAENERTVVEVRLENKSLSYQQTAALARRLDKHVEATRLAGQSESRVPITSR